MIRIAKRDKHLVPFDKKKIVNAIDRAFLEVDGVLYETDTAKDIADEIENILYHIDETTDTPVSVEHVQDLVEDFLMRSERRDVARAYIRYRYKKEVARNHSDEFINAISTKIKAADVQNQNANVDEHSFGGRVGEASNLLMEKYALDYCVSRRTKKNHLDNLIYIHDLSAYPVGMHNCLSIPIDPLAAKGFNTRQIDIRPCKSFSSFGQVSAVVMQLQSLQQFGGVSYTHYDWSSEPYVRMSFTKHLGDGLIYLEGKSEYKLKRFHKWLEHDPEHPDGTIHMDDEAFKALHPLAWEYAMDMTEKEVHQTIEALYHNLNTLQSRSGNQLPFSSINYGTCTSIEGRMVIKALLEVSIEGLGALHKTSIFPCGIFQCMKGVNRAPGDPNYDLYRLALRSTAQRLYPNYANVDWSGNAGYDRNDPRTYFSTMGCRTANGWDVNGLGQRKDGRGNIAPTTIILPTVAMLAKEELLDQPYNQNLSEEEFSTLCVNRFINDLDMYIHQAKDSLIERFEWIANQDASAAKFMYENGLMEGYVPEEGIRSALKHGTLAIGQLGLAETLQILVGCDHTTEKGMEVAKRIEQLFKDRCAEFKETYQLNFGVYYTPAENLCYKAMKKFQARFGKIPNVSDRDYFTNSIHVPVWREVDAFTKIDIESQLTGYSSAGCITYIELDSSIKNNIDALETIVNYAMDKDIPYFAVNVPNDTCLDCGYCDEFNDHCPVCGSEHIQQLRRVTGYLTGNYKTAFNKGKQLETEDRVRHGSVKIGRKEICGTPE